MLAWDDLRKRSSGASKGWGEWSGGEGGCLLLID